ncbi:MAG: energy transducer TonB [Labilithrix sp.]|nr:energy transducer TonB [Labilithrix sp.]
MLTRAGILYLASFAAHGALAVGIVSLKGERRYEDVAISIVEPAKKEAAPPPETPPPPAPPPEDAPAPRKAKLAARAAEPAAPLPEAAPATAGDAVPDFGLSLGGGGAGPGLAVRAAAPAPVAASASAPPVHRVLAAAPAPAETCDEAPKKPKPIAIAQPAYTAEARAANVAGKVRVEITVDATGKVTSVRVLEGLGYGLDEAALAAARAATFEPGTKCGKPATATFTVAMRFTL